MNYAQIRQFDIANGEGIRTTLFVSGCNFHCKDCFNQEYQDFNYGKPTDEKFLSLILEYLRGKNVSGLSILGGDPLWQDEHGLIQLIELCKTTHSYGKTVWLWSGFTWESIFPEVVTDDLSATRFYRQELIKNVDVFIDGQFKTELKDMRLKWRGSSNQRLIDVPKTLKTGRIILWNS